MGSSSCDMSFSEDSPSSDSEGDEEEEERRRILVKKARKEKQEAIRIISETSNSNNSSSSDRGFYSDEKDETKEKRNYQYWKRKYGLKDVSVSLDPLRFKEILITTPKKGEREVYYVSKYLSDSDDETLGKDEDDDDLTDIEDYEDWRLQTISSLPSSSSSKRPQYLLKRKRKKKAPKPKSILLQVPVLESFMFEVSYAKDDLHSILDTLGGNKMTSNVLDGYLMRRLEQYKSGLNRRDKTPPEILRNFQYLSVRFMPVQERDQDPSTIKEDPYWYPKLRSSKLQKSVLLAPQYVSKHFYLAVFNFPKRSVQVYDSSWHYLPMELRTGQIEAILRALLPRASLSYKEERPYWKVNFMTKSSPQYDEYSCGSFAIHYAENVLRAGGFSKATDRLNARKQSDENVIKIRRNIVKELLKTTAIGRKFLTAITD